MPRLFNQGFPRLPLLLLYNIFLITQHSLIICLSWFRPSQRVLFALRAELNFYSVSSSRNFQIYIYNFSGFLYVPASAGFIRCGRYARFNARYNPVPPNRYRAAARLLTASNAVLTGAIPDNIKLTQLQRAFNGSIRRNRMLARRAIKVRIGGALAPGLESPFIRKIAIIFKGILDFLR